MWFLALPSLRLSTILKMFLILVCDAFWYPYERCSCKRLSDASKQITVFCYMSGAGNRAPSKIADLSNTRLTSSLHVYKHLTHTGSIKRLATCCYPWILPQMHHVSLLFSTYTHYDCVGAIQSLLTLRAMRDAIAIRALGQPSLHVLKALPRDNIMRVGSQRVH